MEKYPPSLVQERLNSLPYNPPAGPEIVFADGHVLVVNKPAGLLSVPGKAPGRHECLAARMAVAYPGSQICHRLDLETSGLMVLALTDEARRRLGDAFEHRRVEKAYIARVWGHVEQPSGTVDLPLRCDWPNRPLQMVDHEQGKRAQTDYQVLAHEGETTLVSLTPATGRTHQLRVHMQSLGHVIIGDMLYAQGRALAMSDRLCLHAERLAFAHPHSGEWCVFERRAPFVD